MRPRGYTHPVGTALAVAGTLTVAGAALAAGPAATGAVTAASRAISLNPGPAAADQAAVAYVQRHYRGDGLVRVLATEPDVERGRAVYDVRLTAPDHVTYVAHVSRATDVV